MALPIVLLVSEEKLKSFTSINFNVSPDDLKPYIIDAQNILLPNYIGATYYNALRERVEADTLTDPDINLLDNYIGYMLCNWAMFYALPFIKYRVYNKGVVTGSSEYSDKVDLNELKFLQGQVKTIAEAYTQQMLLHMQTHNNDYPLYATPNIIDGQLPDKASAYTSPLVVPHYAYGRNRRGLYNSAYYNNGLFPGWGCGYDLPDTN